jgi:hypothetical protein
MRQPLIQTYMHFCAILLCSLCSALALPALASGYLESTCDVVAELVGEGKTAPDGTTSWVVQVVSAKETRNAGSPPLCEAVAGTEQMISAVKPSGVSLKKGDTLKLVYSEVSIYPTPHPTEPRKAAHSKTWSFAAAPACDMALSIQVNDAVVAPGETVTLKRGEEVKLTPIARNNSDRELTLTYLLPCHVREIARWTLNDKESALQGGCMVGSIGQCDADRHTVSIPAGEEKALEDKSIKLENNTCYEIPEGTLELSFDVAPNPGVTSCGPSPIIKIAQTP